MSNESRILINNISTDTTDSTYTYGEKRKGAGYNKRSDGLHTVIYTVDAFSGSIKIQGTLEMFPSEQDWTDIPGTEIGGDSTVGGSQTTYSSNFVGNFVWIRAAYNLQSGTIVSVRYNH